MIDSDVLVVKRVSEGIGSRRRWKMFCRPLALLHRFDLGLFVTFSGFRLELVTSECTRNSYRILVLCYVMHLTRCTRSVKCRSVN